MSIKIPYPTALDLQYPGGRRCEPPDPLFGPDGEMLYPDSDGRPMSDNTLQGDWIALIKGGLDLLYRDDPDVFVASNLLWYPVQGRNTRRLAPDAMVAFGRPKGRRGSYQQSKEADIPPQVVFEIWSPSNRRRVMDYRFRFYERYGVEEYYHFEPYKIRLDGWVRDGDALRPIPQTNGWVSPRLGIRFEVGDDMTIFGPDGRPFLSLIERSRQFDEAERLARLQSERADAEARIAHMEARRADAEAGRADAEAAARRAEAERADAAAGRAERLAAQLRAMGMEPEG